MSAGRCQSPALRLIYDNQKEIEDNPGNKVYETKGYFTKKSLEFLLNKEFNDKDQLIQFLEESINFDHIYSYKDKILVVKKPPIPFITSSLQQRCSSECKIKPKTTKTKQIWYLVKDIWHKTSSIYGGLQKSKISTKI